MDDSQFCRDLMGFWTMPDEDNCIEDRLAPGSNNTAFARKYTKWTGMLMIAYHDNQ
jgi:hypothetical protein